MKLKVLAGFIFFVMNWVPLQGQIVDRMRYLPHSPVTKENSSAYADTTAGSLKNGSSWGHKGPIVVHNNNHFHLPASTGYMRDTKSDDSPHATRNMAIVATSVVAIVLGLYTINSVHHFVTTPASWKALFARYFGAEFLKGAGKHAAHWGGYLVAAGLATLVGALSAGGKQIG